MSNGNNFFLFQTVITECLTESISGGQAFRITSVSNKTVIGVTFCRNGKYSESSESFECRTTIVFDYGILAFQESNFTKNECLDRCFAHIFCLDGYISYSNINDSKSYEYGSYIFNCSFTFVSCNFINSKIITEEFFRILHKDIYFINSNIKNNQASSYFKSLTNNRALLYNSCIDSTNNNQYFEIINEYELI